LFRGFTLLLTQANTTGLKLNAVRNSVFEDIGITGSWELTDPVEANSVGLYLNAFSSIVTCKDNLFSRVSATSFSYGVYAKQDIIGNDFHSCEFDTLYTGVSFGVGANLTTIGEQYGPRNNSISDCTFEDILRQGIKVTNGSGNISTSNRFVNVGNDGGGNSQAVYGHVEFDSLSNVSVHDIFDRSSELGSSNSNDAYIGEVLGKTHFVNLFTRQETIVQTATFIPLCRLPLGNAIGYEINYVYQSTTHTQMRSGKINISVDGTNGTLQLSDDFDYTGTAGAELNLQIEAVIEDANSDTVDDTIQLNYKNSTIGENAKFTYTYRSIC